MNIKIKIILFLLFINIAFSGVKEDIEKEASDCLFMHSVYQEAKECFLHFLQKREHTLLKRCEIKNAEECKHLAVAYAFTWSDLKSEMDKLKLTKTYNEVEAYNLLQKYDKIEEDYNNRMSVMEFYASNCEPYSCYSIPKIIDMTYAITKQKRTLEVRDLQAQYLNRACDGGIEDACYEVGR